ncbi:MAG: hypothetical protein K2X66_18915 [Cyanobacteria bacterium]|nr:hypothetical protein [Cyanobacteriota bacterium]
MLTLGADLSLRDYFAGVALNALLVNNNLNDFEADSIEQQAYLIADAMLKERTKAVQTKSNAFQDD